MLKTIQILAIFQGIFLLIILLKKRSEFKRVNFLLLLANIISVLLYVIGDDEFNLFFENTNWYLFHSPLIITLLLLKIRYHHTQRDKFNSKDILFFIPYLCFTILQFIEDNGYINQSILLVLEGIVFAIMILYLLYTMYVIRKFKISKWILFFLQLFTLVYFIDGISYYITKEHDSLQFLESYGVIGLLTFLLYLILFKLIFEPSSILHKSSIKKYKTSSLQQTKIQQYMDEFTYLMETKKLYLNSKLSVNDVANEMKISKQQLSEILNVYMKSNFQNILNEYRVNDFISKLKDDSYKKYTLLAIANEVGFASKSSFNLAFKKHTGMTPSEFKKKA